MTDDRVTEFLLDEVERLRDQLDLRQAPRQYLREALLLVGAHPAVPDAPMDERALATLAECAAKAALIARDDDDIERLLHVADDDVPRLLAEVARLKLALDGQQAGRENLEGPEQLIGGSYWRAVFIQGELKIEPVRDRDVEVHE